MFSCIAYTVTGEICRQRATVLDAHRGGYVCAQHSPGDDLSEVRVLFDYVCRVLIVLDPSRRGQVARVKKLLEQGRDPICAHGFIGPCGECDGSGQVPA